MMPKVPARFWCGKCGQLVVGNAAIRQHTKLKCQPGRSEAAARRTPEPVSRLFRCHFCKKQVSLSFAAFHRSRGCIDAKLGKASQREAVKSSGTFDRKPWQRLKENNYIVGVAGGRFESKR